MLYFPNEDTGIGKHEGFRYLTIKDDNSHYHLCEGYGRDVTLCGRAYATASCPWLPIDSLHLVCEICAKFFNRNFNRKFLTFTENVSTKVTFPSGVTSSKIPRFDLIPRNALIGLAGRFELGEETHKENTWNASTSQDCLTDKAFILARAGHAIDHAFKLIAKLHGRLPDNGDDDASAIAWAGIFLFEAIAALKKEKEGK